MAEAEVLHPDPLPLERASLICASVGLLVSIVTVSLAGVVAPPALLLALVGVGLGGAARVRVRNARGLAHATWMSAAGMVVGLMPILYVIFTG